MNVKRIYSKTACDVLTDSDRYKVVNYTTYKLLDTPPPPRNRLLGYKGIASDSSIRPKTVRHYQCGTSILTIRY